MLAFDNPENLESTLNSMRSIGGHKDYLQEVLLPALRNGNWEELNKMVVYKDEKTTILFGQDVWEFTKSAYEGKGKESLYFTIVREPVGNVIELHQDDRLLINQMKCVALSNMWLSGTEISLSSIKTKVNILRNNISQFVKHGITSFEELDQEQLEVLVDEGCFELSKEEVFKGMNALPALKGLLPYKVNFKRLNHKMFNARADVPEGRLVIPPRIYFKALTDYSDEVTEAYGLRDEIENAVEQMISFHKLELTNRLLRIRNGASYSPRSGYARQWERFTQALDNEGVTLVDKGEDPRWMKIYTSLNTNLDIGKAPYSRFKVRIGGNSYGWSSFKHYLSNLNAKAAWLCIALSGMRVDELYRISPVHGAQKKKFDKNGDESGTGKEIIYFLTTRQSKITLNSQTKNDVFVTTEVGWKAFYVLNAIHTPYRTRFAEKDSHRMFANLSTATRKPIGKNALNKAIKTNFNRDNFDFTLTSEDIGYLQSSDPTQTSFKKGDKFHFTPHQTRRSLAYYLIGYELCSFPALKQQLSHLSMAMTRWYARNAYSFESLYSEIQKERILQKAEIFARIYQKIANGERIAGGKGQAMITEISREGENYFENGVNSRKLSVDYWVDQLTNGKTHLHAVAPGMYCTNTQCSMRINIDLSECVDCEYDFIEDAVYAEGSRMDAMRNIGLLKEYGELNSSSATKYFMQVKAAEAIMEDLGFEHEKFKFEDDVMSLVIKSKMVV